MISKEQLIQSRRNKFRQPIIENAHASIRINQTLSELETLEIIQHFPLIVQVANRYYLSFDNQKIAQATLRGLRKWHKEWLTGDTKDFPVFNRIDKNFRVEITGDYFSQLKETDGIDPRRILHIKTPSDSQVVISNCMDRLEYDSRVDLYDNREQLIKDITTHGLFGIVDNTYAGLYLSDERLSSKIYTGLWMYAPELLQDKNYGRGFTKQITVKGNLQQIQLALEPAQQLIAQYREKSRILNEGKTIGGERQSITHALVEYLIRNENGENPFADSKTIANFLQPVAQRGMANVASSTVIPLTELEQYVSIPRYPSASVIDASHLFARNKQLSKSGTPSPREIEEMFKSIPAIRPAVQPYVAPTLLPTITTLASVSEREQSVSDHEKETAVSPLAEVSGIAMSAPSTSRVTITPEVVADVKTTDIIASSVKPSESSITDIAPTSVPANLNVPSANSSTKQTIPNNIAPPKSTIEQESIKPIQQVGVLMSYSEYINSFGFALQGHREKRNMSRSELADATTRSLHTNEKVSADDIKSWEQSRGKLPSETQFEVLSTTLIDNNPSVTDKSNIRAEFKTAYLKTLAAKQVSSSSNEDDMYLFADKLAELREVLVMENTSITREKLALLITNKLQNPIPKDEADLLTQDRGNFIAGIEAGFIKPSKELLLAIVKTMNDKSILSDSETKEILDAYAKVSEENIEIIGLKGKPATLSDSGEDWDSPPDFVKNIIKAGPSGRRGRKLSNQEPDDPILKIKFKLRKLLNIDELTLGELSNILDVGPTTLGSVISSNANPLNIGGFTKKMHTKLADYMLQKYTGLAQADEKIAEFERLYAELRRVCEETRDRNGSMAIG